MAEAAGVWDHSLEIPRPGFNTRQVLQLEVARIRTLEGRARRSYRQGQFQSARLCMEEARLLWSEELQFPRPSFNVEETLAIYAGEVENFEIQARNDIRNNAFRNARLNMVEAQALWHERLPIGKPEFTLSELQRLALDELEGIEGWARSSVRGLILDSENIINTGDQNAQSANRELDRDRNLQEVHGVLSSLNRKAVSVEETCAICLGAMSSGDIEAEGPCTHRYHDVCIAQWLVQSNSCPMCRAGWALTSSEARASGYLD
ncbi:hypothetical protein N7492_009777 [Penicillium capsulatum]|uniref:RING-type domain-containing protein n=1 Tax=Penicillium capsulatum TaxID=69766 RepID=A0A9W9LFK9_9EURO|nr:hypothetical protein N7492_009777 [Penicillium capsulatum]KAJ6114141.1 hypothetical protein N7512_007586 [Penicillium capsulatum]